MISHGFGVSLGPVDRSALPKLREWRNDYRIWKWCRQNDLISDSDQERWYERICQDRSIRMYTIQVLRKDTDQMTTVGVCGLTSIDLHNRHAEFSLYVAPNFQGLGYAQGALQTLLEHAFRTLNLNLIWGETFDGNHAAEIFEKIGFQKEGTRRAFYYRDGNYLGAHLYSILRDEWMGRLSARGEERKGGVGVAALAGVSTRLTHRPASSAKAKREKETTRSG